MKRKMLKKITSLIITTAILMSCGGFVFADETDEPDVTEPSEETEVFEEPEVIDEPEGVDESEIVDEPEPIEEADPVDETEVIDEEAAIEEADAESEDEFVEERVYEETVVIDDGYDNDYLAEQYIMNAIDPSDQPSYRSYDYGTQLTGGTATAVSYLTPYVRNIANGQRTSSDITIPSTTLSYTFTASDLGMANLDDGDAAYEAACELVFQDLNTRLVIQALMSSCPYDMYWYDKTEGTSCRFSTSINSTRVRITDFRFQFAVAEEYQDSAASEPLYNVNSKFGTAISAASANVQTILDTYAGLDDYRKLQAYKNWICDHVTYNDAAADDSTNTPYGNPWQLIWVFDGDDDTNVVCEGYSKAFQYLCDNSDFICDDIYAISVSGVMYASTVSGRHMWNVVHMEDGNNYLVDVTNCDSGHNLFLVGATGSVSGGYVDCNHGYSYIYDTNAMLPLFSTDVLTLSSTSYVPAPEGIALNSDNFPDANFRAILSNLYDHDHNSYLSPAEIEEIVSLELNYNVRDITGIGYLTSLASLNCSSAQLTNIDLSGFTSLESLSISSSEAGSIDVSNCTSLRSLSCTWCSLTSIDVSGCTSLEVLNCSYNSIEVLDLSDCSSLTTLNCVQNRLTSLDLSNNPCLVSARCTTNWLESLVVGNQPNLVELTATSRYLDTVDVSLCPKLETLELTDVAVIVDGVAQSGSSSLSSLDVSNNPLLTTLKCSGNQLTSLNLSNNPLLSTLDCTANHISVLDISNQPILVAAYNSQDVNRPYSPLRYDGNYGIRIITVSGIEINQTNFPDYYFRSYVSSNFDYDHNGYLSDEEISCIESIDFLSGEGQTLCPNIRDFTGIEYLTSLRSLLLFRVQLTDLDLSGMTSLESLNLMNTESLNSLDLSGCKHLTSFSFNVPGDFTSLNLSGCTSLASLGNITGYYNFTSLDVSGCTLISELDLRMTNLTNLDISGCTSLSRLDAGDSQITTLDMSGSPNLLDAYINGNKLDYTVYVSYTNGDNYLCVPSSARIITGTEISVTGVSLNTDTLTLALGGESATLTATVLPSDATNQNVSWSSSSETVATVSNTGVVTPVAAGTATITVTTEDGGFTASCSVEVADLGVAINATNFPDGAFRSFVNQYDTDHNGYLSDEEISVVDRIGIYNSSINNLTGIKYFTSLSQLHCLPSSNVLDIDLSGCESLTYLYYTNDGSSQATIDLSGCTSLLDLQLSSSSAISSLDLSGCTSLTRLESSQLSGLEYLDVSGCTALTVLVMDGNFGLMYVDLSGCSSLSQLLCYSVGSISINLVGCPYLINAVETGRVWRSTSGVEYQGNPGHIIIDPLAQLLIDSVPVVAVTGITLDQSTLNLTVGNTATLTPNVLPTNATNRCVRWSSRNTAIATVSDTGVVTAVAAGTTTITVTTQDGDLTATCTVTVTNPTVPVTGVTLDHSSLELDVDGDPVTLTTTVLPSDATNQNVSWSSSSETVATVSNTGVVTPVAAGTTTITVTTEDGGFTASCSVVVADLGVAIDATNFPDSVFREYVSQNFDQNHNGYLSVEEISGINYIDLGSNSRDIHDLKGIENFTSLISFSMYEAELIDLDMSGLTLLQSFALMNTRSLNSLNLSGCSHLTSFSFNVPRDFTSLNLSGCTGLASLGNLTGYTNFTSLDISGCTLITGLNLQMTNMTDLNITGCSSLSSIYCFDTQLTTLDISGCSSLINMVETGLAVRMPDRVQYYGTGVSDFINMRSSVQLMIGTEPVVAVTGVSVAPTSLNMIVGGSSVALTANVLPVNATNRCVSWRSGDTNVVTVSDTGVVTPVGVGTTTISVTTNDGSKSASCTVTVVNPTVPVTGVTVSPTTLNLTVGDTSNLTANVLPTNATNRNVTWSSNHSNIARVSNTGVITAVAAGTATITVTTVDGGYTATCTVTVTAPVTTVDMYRLYNTNSGEHFYTSNAAERDMLIGVGWSYEGVGWRAPSRSNTPVYRLYNENGGEHHYTTNLAERDFLVSIGWNDEGIGWYSDDARTVPLYRQYNPNAFANNHNYTTSYSENEWLVSIGWQAEGVGWYGVG